MIKVKNQYVNALKIVTISYAESQKNNKNYLVLETDVLKEQNKLFIEVADNAEFLRILDEIRQQMH